ncbi:EPIDERMAL PATTERNING FACTOR-like protein [Corchorus olitorius]|uniref:Epidermal patterning factor-like protein n=1 Tax=Corchorus olitorius TaxID=93759 RepID=A0A1R3JZ08_9ROSI|nr:EPIDERMAL PATTERNING FACTOR-like protein [Corchorus olitorius]
MAPSSKTCPNNGLLKVAITVIFIFTAVITFLPPSAVGTLKSGESDESSVQKRKMVLGSKPPGCVNKCLSCRPCMATLVIPSHQSWKSTFTSAKYNADKDDSYYLLSWKCKCGDKLFQP